MITTITYPGRTLTVNTESGAVVGHRGLLVGSINSDGYLQVSVERKRSICTHRIVWEAVHGPIPAGLMIDHINGIQTDNRIANLRLCSTHQNQWNRHRLQGAVPHKGVCLHKQTGKYQAQIKVLGKSIYLGLFATPEEAADAYRMAARRHFGEFSSEAA